VKEIKPVFQPEPRPRILKSNINKITQHIVKRVTEIGYDVHIAYSHKSRSRYLEVKFSKERKLIIRISDHPADRNNRWRYKFDIHASVQRRGSVDYIEFLDAFKQIVGESHPLAEKISTGSSREKEYL
jgi:hypothetical protein